MDPNTVPKIAGFGTQLTATREAEGPLENPFDFAQVAFRKLSGKLIIKCLEKNPSKSCHC